MHYTTYSIFFVEPTGFPTKVRVEAISSTSISISWKPPAVHEWNGVITSYIVIVKSLSKEATLDYEFQPDGDCWLDCVIGGLYVAYSTHTRLLHHRPAILVLVGEGGLRD